MDDGRALIHPMRPGMSWCEDGGIRYCKLWEELDEGLSYTERTKRVLEGMMKGVMKGLKMTQKTKLSHF